MSARDVVRTWSLRRRLVVGATGLVLVALLLAAVATVLALRGSLIDRLDEDVRAGLVLAARPESAGTAADDGAGAEPGASGPRQRAGTLEVVLAADGVAARSAYVSPDGTTVPLTAAQLAVISAALDDATIPGADAARDRAEPAEGLADAPAESQPAGAPESVLEPTTVDLGGQIGDFRIAAETRDGITVVSGLSMRDTAATLGSLITILAVVLGAALLLAAFGIAWLVTVALRPLRRVADTAERVARRPLADGDVTVPERAGLTDDPRTEVGRVGVALDTLLSHVETSLQARQASEERLRAFIADASHELRTPLASIRGYAQLAQDAGDPGTGPAPVRERSLDRIESEAARMGALVEDLLLLARLDAGQPLLREPVDAALLAIETTDDARVAHPDHVWRVEVDASIELSGDERRLRQVLINLLGNAAAHTPPGTTVTVSAERAGDEARLVVADDGPGIDPELLPRLFDRFSRGDAARNRASGSTGLGLSIAEAIVREHGGTIAVAQGEPGTVFTVALPAAAAGARRI